MPFQIQQVFLDSDLSLSLEATENCRVNFRLTSGKDAEMTDIHEKHNLAIKKTSYMVRRN